VTWQKYHYEIGFIQQEMRILGHAIPAKGIIKRSSGQEAAAAAPQRKSEPKNKIGQP
jgi:hypothetical protein